MHHKNEQMHHKNEQNLICPVTFDAFACQTMHSQQLLRAVETLVRLSSGSSAASHQSWQRLSFSLLELPHSFPVISKPQATSLARLCKVFPSILGNLAFGYNNESHSFLGRKQGSTRSLGKLNSVLCRGNVFTPSRESPRRQQI